MWKSLDLFATIWPNKEKTFIQLYACNIYLARCKLSFSVIETSGTIHSYIWDRITEAVMTGIWLKEKQEIGNSYFNAF